MTFEKWWSLNAPCYGYTDVHPAAIDAWNAAVIAEREACAKLCEEMKDPWSSNLYEHACKECAEAIRARGTERSEVKQPGRSDNEGGLRD